MRLLIRSVKKGEAAELRTRRGTRPRTPGARVSRSLLTEPQLR